MQGGLSPLWYLGGCGGTLHTRLSILLLIAPLLAGPCALALPAQGPMVREFSPDGLYGGHWGIDVAVDPGTSVRAAGAGIVTFSGVVAGDQTGTVRQGRGGASGGSPLDGVPFVPAGAPWQKVGQGVTDAVHRWEMTRLAVQGVAYFRADDREACRDGWTYTMDTLGEFADDAVVLILGAEAAAG